MRFLLSATTLLLVFTSRPVVAQAASGEELNRLSRIDICVAFLTDSSRANLAAVLDEPAIAQRSCTCAIDRIAIDPAYSNGDPTKLHAADWKSDGSLRKDLASKLLSCASEAIAGVPEVPPSLSHSVNTLATALTTLVPPFRSPAAFVVDMKSCPKIEYPTFARAEGAEGTTRLAFRVDSSGLAKSVDVVVSSGGTPAHKQLDYAAASAFVACRFNPAKRNAVGAEGWSIVSFDWKLTSTPAPLQRR